MIDGAIRLLRVYERKTKSGTIYFLGSFGRSRVLIKRADGVKVNDDTIAAWDIFIKERDPEEDRRIRAPATGECIHDGPVDTHQDRQRRPSVARPKARSATSNTTAANKSAR